MFVVVGCFLCCWIVIRLLLDCLFDVGVFELTCGLIWLLDSLTCVWVVGDFVCVYFGWFGLLLAVVVWFYDCWLLWFVVSYLILRCVCRVYVFSFVVVLFSMLWFCLWVWVVGLIGVGAFACVFLYC